jgi:RNA polymerase sigma-70 factor (ECF subfamily)
MGREATEPMTRPVGRADAAWYGTALGASDQSGGAVFLGQQALAHADALFNLARYLTGNDSDGADLVQETYARALGAAGQFDGRNLKAWLCKILRNAFIDLHRRKKHDPTRGGLDTRSDLDGPVDADLLREDLGLEQLRNVLAADLEAALMTLSEDARAIILLDLEGLTEVEVADVIGCAVGTVKSRLSRARLMLRRRLKDYAR